MDRSTGAPALPVHSVASTVRVAVMLVAALTLIVLAGQI